MALSRHRNAYLLISAIVPRLSPTNMISKLAGLTQRRRWEPVGGEALHHETTNTRLSRMKTKWPILYRIVAIPYMPYRRLSRTLRSGVAPHGFKSFGLIGGPRLEAPAPRVPSGRTKTASNCF